MNKDKAVAVVLILFGAFAMGLGIYANVPGCFTVGGINCVLGWMLWGMA